MACAILFFNVASLHHILKSFTIILIPEASLYFYLQSPHGHSDQLNRYIHII